MSNNKIIKSDNNRGSLAVGVLATFMLLQVSFILTPAINALSEYYTEIPYSQILLLQTVVYITIIPFSLISGALTGTRLRYKTVAIFAAAVMCIAGFLPLFSMIHNNFTLVLICRGVFGIGEGMGFPVGAALILRYYTGAKRSRLQGISTIVLCGSGVVYQYTAGALCEINVHLIWALHAALLIPIVLVAALLPEPEKLTAAPRDVDEASTDSEKPEKSMRMNIIAITFGLLFVPLFAVLLNMSSFISHTGVCSTSSTGLIAACYPFGGLCAGLLYSWSYRTFKRYLVMIFLGLSVVAGFLCIFSQNAFMLMLCEFLFGLCAFTLYPCCCRDFDTMANAKGVMFGSGLIGAMWNLGAFLSTYLISGTYAVAGREDPMLSAKVSLILLIGFFIIWSFFRLRRPKALEIDYRALRKD